MRRGRWYREVRWSRRFERARPRPVAGGIKADVRTSSATKHPWARRWLEVLERMGFGPRLSRGRSYARSGQVKSIEITCGIIRATVQGTRPQPYEIEIRVEPFAAERWRETVRALPQQLLLAAKLLAGELSDELEQGLAAAGMPLLPERASDLVTQCTCPDFERPCKHVAAVYYIFGAELERDPFLLLQLRGIARDELLAALSPAGAPAGATGDGDAPPKRSAKPGRGAKKTAKELSEPDAPAHHEPAAGADDAAPPLPADPNLFWKGGELPPLRLVHLELPALPAALLRRLGPFPFWRGSMPLLQSLEPIYRSAAIAAAAICLAPLLGEADEDAGGGSAR